eukprot:65260-Prorocentrum_lima.AAC.1
MAASAASRLWVEGEDVRGGEPSPLDTKVGKAVARAGGAEGAVRLARVVVGTPREAARHEEP